jgi:predicted adenine nucleotide alpha hydrolase (AANH) superfamily ATPase
MAETSGEIVWLGSNICPTDEYEQRSDNSVVRIDVFGSEDIVLYDTDQFLSNFSVSSDYTVCI